MMPTFDLAEIEFLLGGPGRVPVVRRSNRMQVAISYIRFSSAQQSEGDSLRRQLEMTRTYATKHNLSLDESLTYRDLGVSGWKGKHRTEGMLKALLDGIKAGRVRPGTALLVERLDRLTREGFMTGVSLMMDILKAGVDVHSVASGRIFRMPKTATEEFAIGIEWGAEFFQAALENEKKSERLTSAWRNKKHNSASGISISNKMPGWLEGAVGSPIKIRKERADLVQRIFELSSKGFGKRYIARQFNLEKIPTWGDGKRQATNWSHSYIGKILTNRAVLGEYQPYKGSGKNRVVEGALRTDVYPAVIAPELWDKAQESIKSRLTFTEKGEATSKFNGRLARVSNLFTGLICDEAGLPIHYIDKGRKDPPRLVTSNRQINGTASRSLVYSQFERSFLHWLDELDWSTILNISDSSDIADAEKNIANLKLSLERTENQVRLLTDKMLELDTPAAAVNKRLLELEDKSAVEKAAFLVAEKKLIEAKARHNHFLNQSVVFSTLVEAKDIETRVRLREEIRRKVSKIGIDFSKTGSITATIVFVNGARKAVIFKGDSITLAQQVSFDRPEIVPRLLRSSGKV